MAEELALEQRLGKRGAVDRDERSLCTLTRAVDAARHELLAGAGLALDEHADGGCGGALHQAEHVGHGGRASDHVGEPIATRDVPPQRADLGTQLLFGRLDTRV